MIPITKPTLSPYKKYEARLRSIISKSQLTNGQFLLRLEKEVATYTGAKYCVAVSSCTAGLMLTLKGLALTGEVIVPSFTFSATGHVLLWNDLTPVFADCEATTYNIDPNEIEKRITPRTTAILGTHIFGNPCNVTALQAVAKKHKLKLIFDAAHGLGSRIGTRHVGTFGDAEIFSCSPTKLMTTGEGGFVLTNNKALADFCRIGRNYGDNGTYNTAFNGLNARMSELHAVIGLESLRNLDQAVKNRNTLVTRYKKGLLSIDPHLQFQQITTGATTTYKDFSILVDPKKSGYTRDQLYEYLKTKGIASKKYFYPPLHRQDTYATFAEQGKRLPITSQVADNILCLPLWSHMKSSEIDEILRAIKKFYSHVQ